MSDLFLWIFNTSLSAGLVILAVILCRLLLLRAPRGAVAALWSLVALRVLLPFKIKAPTSLIPSAEVLPPEALTSPSPQISTGIPLFNNAVNPPFTESFAPAPDASVNPLQVAVGVAANLWLLGVILFLAVALFRAVRLGRRLRVSLPLEEGVRMADGISSPFVWGVFRPTIYLPSDLRREQLAPVLAHERAHLRRGDPLWKMIGFLLLSVFWFHPLFWLGFSLFSRDLEYAADARAIFSATPEERAQYSKALLELHTPRHAVLAHLGFGEVGIRGRIRAVLSFRKPTLWLLIVAILAGVILGVCFLTDPFPKTENAFSDLPDGIYQPREAVYGELAGGVGIVPVVVDGKLYRLTDNIQTLERLSLIGDLQKRNGDALATLTEGGAWTVSDSDAILSQVSAVYSAGDTLLAPLKSGGTLVARLEEGRVASMSYGRYLSQSVKNSAFHFTSTPVSFFSTTLHPLSSMQNSGFSLNLYPECGVFHLLPSAPSLQSVFYKGSYEITEGMLTLRGTIGTSEMRSVRYRIDGGSLLLDTSYVPEDAAPFPDAPERFYLIYGISDARVTVSLTENETLYTHMPPMVGNVPFVNVNRVYSSGAYTGIYSIQTKSPSAPTFFVEGDGIYLMITEDQAPYAVTAYRLKFDGDRLLLIDRNGEVFSVKANVVDDFT